MAPVAPGLGGGDRTAVPRDANDDCIETVAEIGPAGGQPENGHDLRCGGNHETRLTVCPIALQTESNADTAKGAVVYVECARPRDLRRIEVQCVAMEEVGVDHGGQQVMCGSDGVKVAVEMQVDLLAGFHLRETASGCPAFEAEDRPQRWFAGSDDGFVAHAFEGLGQSNGNNRLAFSGNGGRGRRNKDELAADRKGRIGEYFELELGAIGAERFIVGWRKRKLCRNFLDRQQRCRHEGLHPV